jgi:hypothetical protein
MDYIEGLSKLYVTGGFDISQEDKKNLLKTL